jgi:hypothetical protein
LYVGDATSAFIVEAFAFPAGTPLAGSPYAYSSGANSNTVLASKDGKCLFVANQFSSGVSAIPLSGGIPGATATLFPAGVAGSLPSGMANDISAFHGPVPSELQAERKKGLSEVRPLAHSAAGRKGCGGCERIKGEDFHSTPITVAIIRWICILVIPGVKLTVPK